jgi:putative endonuclease
VVLNACLSADQAAAITRHIECAVGMSAEIGDLDARVFAAQFYSALGYGRDVAAAFEQAKAAVHLQNLPDHAVPRLMSREGMSAAEIRFGAIGTGTVLSGIVFFNELSGRPLAGVTVSAAGANDRVTDSRGMFRLTFPDRRPGQHVRLVLALEGHELVNDVQAEAVTLPEQPDDPSSQRVFLVCRAGERDLWARRYFRLRSEEAVEQAFREREQRLKQAGEDNAKALAQLRAEPEHLRRGRLGEAAAKRHLKRAGLKFLTANFRTPRGELDLVFRDGDCLVFVEVKTRSSEEWTRPARAVDADKRRKLTRVAFDYLRRLKNPRVKLRFDIVEVLLANGTAREVRHLPAAFTLSAPYRHG